MTSTSERPTFKPALRSGQTVLVAGGRGFVGAHIVRALLDAGCHVHVLGPVMQTDLLADVQGRFGSVDCGIEDAVAVRTALTRLAPAAVVVCSAFGSGGEGLMRASEGDADQAFAINVDGLRHMASAAREAGVGQVVWTSSTTVYGDASSYAAGRVDESAPKRPGTLYGLTKHLAEEIGSFAMHRDGFPVIGLRLPLVLGPGLWYRGAAAALIAMVRAARPGARHEIAFHNEPIDLMHVRDAAAAVLSVLRHAGPLAPIYNINGFTARAREIAQALTERVPGFHVDFHEQTPERVFPLIDDGRFRRDTGFAPQADLQRLILETLSTDTGLSP
ncbi:MAG: NAD(P)-dependent oxidoreductase [Rhizobacter sp.]|nr:NAD(P)-dependent oxidoreductase [Rhizobacter sp.]